MSKLKPYEEYYPVELNYMDKLPIGWKLLRGKFVFKEVNERSEDGKEQLLSVSEHKGVVPRDSINVNMFQAEDYKGYKLCIPGDVVINSLWAWHRGIGVAEHKGIVSTAYSVHRLRKPNEWNYKYLTYLLRTDAYTGEYFIRSKGVWISRLQLTGKNFQDIQIIIPPLETQNAIVNYLDRKTQQIQEFIQKKERLIELLEERLNKAIFSLIIESSNKQAKKSTNSTLQPLVPENWQEYRIKFLCSTPITGQWGEEPKEDKNDIICIRVADYNKLGLNNEGHTVRNIVANDCLLLRENDLLIEKSGGGDKTPVGRVVKFSLPVKAVTSNFISKISANKTIVLSDYLLHIFNCLNIVRYNLLSIKQTTGIQNLDLNHYLSNKIYIPNIEEQNIIVEQINSLTRRNDYLIQKAQLEVEKLKEYQESLITQVVTGQLKV